MTPEERLFRIIQSQESDQEETDSNATSARDGTKEGAMPFSAPHLDLNSESLSQGQNSGSKTFLLENPRAILFSGVTEFFSLKTLNRMLGIFTVALILFFIADLFFLRADPVDLFFKKVNSASNLELQVADVPLSAGLTPDNAVVSQRNVFRPWVPPVAIAQASTGGVPIKSVAGLKLAGIYMDVTPEALIEVMDEKKTYVVQAGSQVKGMTVKEVKESGVIFSDGKEEYFLQ